MKDANKINCLFVWFMYSHIFQTHK